MGCDIHIWLEYRRKGTDRWMIMKRQCCGACGGSGTQMGRVKLMDDNYEETEERCWSCKGSRVDRLVEVEDTYENNEGQMVKFTRLTGGDVYDGRDYRLFAILAGVRNYGGEEPLFEPRGIPGDASPEFRRLCEQWDGDAHSTGWLDLEDITALIVANAPLAHEGGENPMSWFYQQAVVLMQRIAAKQGPKNVRVVFFFDN